MNLGPDFQHWGGNAKLRETGRDEVKNEQWLGKALTKVRRCFIHSIGGAWKSALGQTLVSLSGIQGVLRA